MKKIVVFFLVLFMLYSTVTSVAADTFQGHAQRDDEQHQRKR